MNTGKQNKMKAYIVTGANKGIGYEIVRKILNNIEGSFVFLGCRDTARGDEAIKRLVKESKDYENRIELLEVDVANPKSITDAFDRFKKRIEENGDINAELEALVNNAGIMSTTLKTNCDVNARGVYNMTKTFAPILKKNGKVVNLTSGAGPQFVEKCNTKFQDFFFREDLNYEELDSLMMEVSSQVDEGQGLKAKKLVEMGNFGDNSEVHTLYSFSKALANAVTVALHNEFPQLKINACTPGFIWTDMTAHFSGGDEKKAKEMGMKDVGDGTFSTMKLLTEDDESNGLYFGSDGLRSPMHKFRSSGAPEYKGGR